MQITNKKTKKQADFFFNFLIFLKLFEMKLHSDLENPKSAIKKNRGGGGVR
jgi:hypothetical protein